MTIATVNYGSVSIEVVNDAGQLFARFGPAEAYLGQDIEIMPQIKEDSGGGVDHVESWMIHIGPALGDLRAAVTGEVSEASGEELEYVESRKVSEHSLRKMRESCESYRDFVDAGYSDEEIMAFMGW